MHFGYNSYLLLLPATSLCLRESTIIPKEMCEKIHTRIIADAPSPASAFRRM